MIPANLLRRIRNDLPMPVTIAALGNEAPPSKFSEGYFRFLCPNCGEMKATVNPRTNLAHCFCCGENLNNIDLLIQLGYSFPSAVALLESWLLRYQTQEAQTNQPAHRAEIAARSNPDSLNLATNAIGISTGTTSRLKSQSHRLQDSALTKHTPVRSPSVRDQRSRGKMQIAQNHRTPPLQNSQQFGKTTLSKPKSLQR